MASPLVDMKYTKAEQKEEKREIAAPSPQEYPWGLAIRLEDEELTKLGVKTMPGVGDEIHLMAIAKVTGVNQSATAKDSDCCVSLQITMLQVLMHETAAEEKGEKETPAAEAKETPRKYGVLGA